MTSLLRNCFRCLFAVGLSLSANAEEAGYRPIFNGKDLTGWDGDPKVWSVKDGAIRGETSLSHLAFHNTFCIWRAGELKDFALRIKFRITSGNSGVQYRSKDLGNWIVSGYQAEVVNEQGKVGFLYEEKGRKYLANVGESVTATDGGNRQVAGAFAGKEAYSKWGYYKDKDWNEYLIVAKGNWMAQYLNGFETIELIDNDEKNRALSGILALQVHAGAPMLVEFKDILLKTL